MDKTKMFKVGLSVLGMGLTFVGTLVNDKVKDNKMEETIAKKVEEALKKQV